MFKYCIYWMNGTSECSQLIFDTTRVGIPKTLFWPEKDPERAWGHFILMWLFDIVALGAEAAFSDDDVFYEQRPLPRPRRKGRSAWVTRYKCDFPNFHLCTRHFNMQSSIVPVMTMATSGANMKFGFSTQIWIQIHGVWDKHHRFLIIWGVWVKRHRFWLDD